MQITPFDSVLQYDFLIEVILQMQGQAQSQEDDSSERKDNQTKNSFIKLRKCICSDRFDILLKVCTPFLCFKLIYGFCTFLFITQ